MARSRTGRGGKGLRLERGVLARIYEHAAAAYPEEACGGLFGQAVDGEHVEVVEAAPVANTREDERRRRYLIGPEDVLALEKRAAAAGVEVVGYYHSHPDAPAEPSEFDRAHAWPWYVYLIVGVAGGRAQDVRAWRLANSRAAFEPMKIWNAEDSDDE